MRYATGLYFGLFTFWAAAGIIQAADNGYDSHGRRNPFVPPAKMTPQAIVKAVPDVDTRPLEQWFAGNIGGIVWDEENPYALIGDNIVSIGDEVRGCVIVDITPSSIVFEYRERRVEVPIIEPEYQKERGRDEY